jgi:hypothetical protein
MWMDNPQMDSQNELEALRARLAAMSRAEAIALADRAGLSASTVCKFRGGHIQEIGGQKFLALRAALKTARAKAVA